MPVVFKNGSISSRIIEHMQHHSAFCNYHISNKYNISKKCVATSLNRLYRNRLLNRLEVRTDRGKIYYRGNSKKRAINFGIKHNYIPKGVKTLMQILDEKKAVGELDLIYTHGVRRWEIHWIVKHMKNIINFEWHENIKIFYSDKKYLEKYLKSEQWIRNKKIQEKRGREAQRIGSILEDVLERLYKKRGYKVQKHRAFYDKIKRGYVFFDLYCTKADEPPIIVEAKNTFNCISAGDLLKLHILTENIFGEHCRVDFYSVGGISYYLFNCHPGSNSGHGYPFLRAFPNYRVFGLSQLKKLAKQYKISVREVIKARKIKGGEKIEGKQRTIVTTTEQK